MKRAALTTVRVSTGLLAIAVFGCGGLASNEGGASTGGSSSSAGAGGSGGLAASGGTTSTGGVTTGAGGSGGVAASGGTANTGGVTTGAGGTDSVQVNAARSELARVVDPQVPAEDAQTLSADNAAFAFAAYPLLKHDSDNLVFWWSCPSRVPSPRSRRPWAGCGSTASWPG